MGLEQRTWIYAFSQEPDLYSLPTHQSLFSRSSAEGVTALNTVSMRKILVKLPFLIPALFSS